MGACAQTSNKRSQSYLHDVNYLADTHTHTQVQANMQICRLEHLSNCPHMGALQSIAVLIPCKVKDADGVTSLLQTPDSNLTVNACGWVVLDTQINVLIDAKSKVSCVTEVPSEQLILLDLQPTLLQEESHILRAVSVMLVCTTKQFCSL